MAKYNYIQNAFTSGELSQKFKGRTDTREYYNGCEELLNFIPYRQGGAARRPGTKHVEVITKEGAALIPFIFSKTEAYVIVINPRGSVPPGTTDLEIFRNNGDTTTVTLSGTPGTTNLLPASLDHRGFHYAQLSDVIFITHNSGTISPIIIKRTGVSAFTWINFADTSVASLGVFGVDSNPGVRRPYLDPNITSGLTLTPSVTTGVGTLTASLAGFFTADSVGDYYKITHGGTTGIAEVTGFTSGTVVDIVIHVDFGAAAASDNWQKSAWGTLQGFPRTLTIFEQRLVFGGTLAQPDTFFGSLTNNFFHFMERKLAQDSVSDVSGINYFGPAESTDPYQFTIASGEVNPIQWMASGRDLQIGTLGAEYFVTGGQEILSNESIQVRKQTTHGGSPVQAAQVDNKVLFLSRDGKRIREFEFNFEQDTYITRNLSLGSDEIIYHNFNPATDSHARTEITSMAYQESRGTLWCLNSHEALIGLTLDRAGTVVAWHKHVFGGTATGGISPRIHGMCIIPNSEGTTDELFLNVEREINGSTVFHLEKIGADFENPSLISDSVVEDDDPRYLDAHKVTKSLGSPTNTVLFAATHLTNATVDVLADGKVQRNKVLNVATLTIDFEAERFIVGLPYRSRCKPMPLEVGQEFGSAQGNVKRVDRATVKVYNSYGMQIGETEDDLERIIFRENYNYGDPLSLFTGDKRISFDGGHDRDYSVVIEQDLPLPLNILSITFRGVMYD